MDGRFVLLGFIVIVAGVTARDTTPVRPPGAAAADRARERAVDAVIVGVDHAQLCYLRRRGEYADTLSSLAFSRGHYMRTALENRLDITLHTTHQGHRYEQRVTGEGVDAVVRRDGTEVMRLHVGDRSPPQLATHC